jgi:hypothetical protein
MPAGAGPGGEPGLAAVSRKAEADRGGGVEAGTIRTTGGASPPVQESIVNPITTPGPAERITARRYTGDAPGMKPPFDAPRGYW